MVQRLDRYVAGNLKALAVVRVPSEAEEAARTRVRRAHDQFLVRPQSPGANRGRRACCWNTACRRRGSWWRADNWMKTKEIVKQHKLELAPEVLLSDAWGYVTIC